jgi:hypothetical protein
MNVGRKWIIIVIAVALCLVAGRQSSVVSGTDERTDQYRER